MEYLKCKDCEDFKECSRLHDLRKYRRYCQKAKTVVSRTNFERICLSEETLADFLTEVVVNGPDFAANTHFRFGGKSIAEWCDWLREEIKS